MSLEVLGKRSQALLLREEDIPRVPKEDILSVEDLEPKPFPKEEPPTVIPAGQEHANAAEWAKYTADKAEWEQHNAVPEGVKRVVALVPVTKVTKATMDGHELKIFHTVRGPIMAAVQHEDTIRAHTFSPCMIDPNIARGRVHFLPIAFAGFKFTVYKASCIGESVPQEAEIRGYPTFVKNNAQGDYVFRMKSAYHHIDADMADDAQVASVELAPREAQEGLIPTSDAGEKRMVDQARQTRALTEAAQAE